MVIVKASVRSCGLEQSAGEQRSAVYTWMSWTSGTNVAQSVEVEGGLLQQVAGAGDGARVSVAALATVTAWTIQRVCVEDSKRSERGLSKGWSCKEQLVAGLTRNPQAAYELSKWKILLQISLRMFFNQRLDSRGKKQCYDTVIG